MTEGQRIAGQLRRAWSGPSWAGPDLEGILIDVTAEEASAWPLKSTHTIWELLLHLTAWHSFALSAIEGSARDVPDESNFPAVVDTSEEAWALAREQHHRTRERLRERVKTLSDDTLEEIVPEREYSYYFLLHGLAQHDFYHAGQMTLLKKAVRGAAPP